MIRATFKFRIQVQFPVYPAPVIKEALINSIFVIPANAGIQ